MVGSEEDTVHRIGTVVCTSDPVSAQCKHGRDVYVICIAPPQEPAPVEVCGTVGYKPNASLLSAIKPAATRVVRAHFAAAFSFAGLVLPGVSVALSLALRHTHRQSSQGSSA